MLLAVDAGNTHTVLGLFEGEVMRAHWRVSTSVERTADELGIQMLALLRIENLDAAAVDGVIVASVVPDLDRVITDAVRRYFGCEARFVGAGVDHGIPILYDTPADVGADRIVNAVAALARYGPPVLILDFGTATTLDVVSPRGEYLGGTITPGIGVSAEALFRRAARLRRVDVRRPDRVVGRTTAESIQSGLFYGYVGLVEGLIRRARAEIGAPDAPVVATGGLAGVLAGELPFLREVDPWLTLSGLLILWKRGFP